MKKNQIKRGRKPKPEIVAIIPPKSLKVIDDQPLLLKKQVVRPLPILKLIQYPIPGLGVNHG